jgi:DNA modification methylase
MAFVGLSDSYEQFYQAVRRCWRFGQKKSVVAYIVTADTEGAVLRNIQRKEIQAAEMMEEIVGHTQDARRDERKPSLVQSDLAEGSGWSLYLGDCVQTMPSVKSDSIGLSIFSPPFPGMYAYTDSPNDMGNVRDQLEMVEQFKFLIPELLRVLIPGRTCAIHLTQGVAFKGSDGYTGLKDFRGAIIKAMEDGGFIYYGEVAIDKDPQVKAIRTKDRGLLFKSLANDSAHMHMALADYLLQFRKRGDNPHPIRAGISQKYDNEHGWITPEEWIEWAAPVWYRSGNGRTGGIRETDVLNVSGAREGDDERHLCPLQLGVIERAVKLWSAPGETVLSPFAGIGSEGYMALQLLRKFIGIELKRSYWDTARKNLAAAERQMLMPIARGAAS